jgi:hypothetical protein
MSDWISKAVDKQRRKEEKKRHKEERKRQKQVDKEMRDRLLEEKIMAEKQLWFAHNKDMVISAYQLIETHTNRAKDAGFQLYIGRSRDESELLIHGDGGNRRINIAPNYDDGFTVIFTITRYQHVDLGGSIPKTKKKKRNYAFNKIPERKILSWIKWAAIGRRPFWLV